VLGGAAGLVAAAWGADLLASLYSVDSAGRALAFDLTLSAPVVTAALVLTLVTALLAGGIPAWHASRADVIGVLKDEGASGGARRARLRTLLVSGQVAVSIVLLVGAVLLIESGQRALGGPGFDAEQVITLRLRPSLVDYSRERAHAFHHEVIRALESLPGVISASPSVFMSIFSAGPRVSTADPRQPDRRVDALANAVGPRYFETLGVRVTAGREFTAEDRMGGLPVAIVNDVLAERLWPDQHAVGLTLVADHQPYTVIAVVEDTQYYATGDAPRPQVFFSYWQSQGDDTFFNDSRTFVRVAGDPALMMSAVRLAITTVDAAVPISEAHPLRDRVRFMFQPVRMARAMLTSFAMLAVALSAVGLYGVLAFSVARRTREIGLRIALGATPRLIAVMVLRDGLLLTSAGVVVGLAAAWHTTQYVGSLLFGLGTRDLTAFVAAPAVLAAVALVASYLPARRAARVSPLAAMRTE
jgi:predicted permease